MSKMREERPHVVIDAPYSPLRPPVTNEFRYRERTHALLQWRRHTRASIRCCYRRLADAELRRLKASGRQATARHAGTQMIRQPRRARREATQS